MMPPAEQLYAEVIELKIELAGLRAQIAWLKKRLFGGGQSEKLDREQLLLALGELEAQVAQADKTETITYQREKPDAQAKREASRQAFEKLPVTETIVIDPDEVKAEPAAYEKIGEEKTVELDIIPPRLVKRQIIRPKYRRKDNRSRPPLLAPAPARPVPGGYASAGLLAYIIVAKYHDHQPLRRLENQSARWGMQLPAQSMVEWMRIASELLEPIYKTMRNGLLNCGYIQIDETPVRCNDPGQPGGGTTKGYLWVMGTPGGDVLFEWKPNRAHEHAAELLGENYRGTLQSDAYPAYKHYAASHPGVVAVGCWAHARRYIFEAQAEHPKATRVALKLIARLYRLEREWDAQGVACDHVRAYHRTRHYARTLRWLKTLAQRGREKTLPQSLCGKATTYLLNQWDSLEAHTRLGWTRLDNNLIENSIRPSAVGKKNWLFIGHPDAGQRTAILYTIIGTCKRRGVDPLAYLRDVLSRLPAMSNHDDLTPLLPANWQPPASQVVVNV